MGVRISVATVLAACCVWHATKVQAQGFAPQSAFGPPNMQAMSYPDMHSSSMPGAASYGSPADAGFIPGYAPEGRATIAETGGLFDGGFDGEAYNQHGEGCPCPQCAPYMPPQPSFVDQVWSLDAKLASVFASSSIPDSWIRAEYLHWRFENPGNRLLGSQLSTVEHPAASFPVFDLADNPIGRARVPTLGDINLKDNPGLRMTYGVPLTFGEFELSGFVMNQAGDFGTVPEIPKAGRFAATSTFLNGQLFNNVQLWDQALRYDYKVDLWGVDTRVIVDTGPAGEGFHLKPLYGLKMMNLEEQIVQLGIFTDSGRQRSQNGLLDIKTRNWFYGPTIGARMELEHRWFQVGIDPSVTLGLNSSSSRVSTANFAQRGDPVFKTRTRSTDFSPLIELKAWLRVPVTENLSLFGGYTVLYAPKTARPASSVNYDVISFTNGSNVHARKNLEEWDAHGFNIGAEYRFP